MKTTILFLILIFLTFLNGLAQEEEHFVYCVSTSSDTFVISKISEVQVGDTLIKEYTGYTYYIFNDSIFAKHDGQYYLIGANNAQVGDIWHPMRYNTNTSTPIGFLVNSECVYPRNLKVTDVEIVYINNQEQKKYTLVDTNEMHAMGGVADEYITYEFISGVGATKGGLYYNFSSSGRCMTMFDAPYFSFKGYGIEDFYFSEQVCDVVGIKESLIEQPILFNNNGILTVEINQNDMTIQLVDICGKTVLKTNENTINVRDLKGLYFVVMENKDGKVYQAKVVL